MLMLTIFAALLGAVLGLRFQVLVLLPGIGLLLLGVPIVGAAYSASLSTIVLALVLSIVCLQFGYLGGIGTRYVMVLSRAYRIRVGWSRRAAARPAG